MSHPAQENAFLIGVTNLLLLSFIYKKSAKELVPSHFLLPFI
ncbi:hypothetical protein bpmyx0001_47200 [Bacillus pseudomycoides DSM 12442]|nr:hypothetical protein bpmyx0001_47200 [Bacillus pseudomycoides DSM 12442]